MWTTRPPRPVAVAGASAAALALITLGACGSSAHDAARSAPPAGRPATAADLEPTTTAAPPAMVATTVATQLPLPLSREAVATDGSSVLLLGGLTTGDVSTSDVEEVGLSSGQTSMVGHLARAVHDTAAATLGGRTFVFGGGSAETVAEVQRFSPGATTASETGSLPEPRSDLSVVAVGGNAVVIGGFDGTGLPADVLETSDGSSFRVVAQLDQPVRYAAVAALGNTVWVVGGVTGASEGSTTDTSDIQRIDLSTGTVTIAGHLPEPLGHAAAAVVGGRLYVFGGRSGTTPSAQIMMLDPSTAAVADVGSLPQAQSDAGVAVAGDSAYLLGGETDGPDHPLTSVIRFGPASGQ